MNEHQIAAVRRAIADVAPVKGEPEQTVETIMQAWFEPYDGFVTSDEQEAAKRLASSALDMIARAAVIEIERQA